MLAGSCGHTGLGRTILIVLPIVCLAAGCAPDTAPQSDQVRPVKTMVVQRRRRIAYALRFPGKVVASKTAELAFLVSGLLVKFPVREGQRVAKGEMIAQLRQDEFQAQFKIRKVDWISAQSDLTALRAGRRTEQRERLEANVTGG